MSGLVDKLKIAINKAFPFMELPLSISRQSNFPLDKSSLWWDETAATNYAKSDPTAYPGQPITVVDEVKGAVKLFIIKPDSTLELVGSMSSVTALQQELAQHKVDYNALKSAHDQLKAAHDQLKSSHNALDAHEKQLKKDHDALKAAFDKKVYTADEITETTNRVFVTPAQKSKIDTIVYATNEDIDSLFPELKA